MFCKNRAVVEFWCMGIHVAQFILLIFIFSNYSFKIITYSRQQQQVTGRKIKQFSKYPYAFPSSYFEHRQRKNDNYKKVKMIIIKSKNDNKKSKNDKIE